MPINETDWYTPGISNAAGVSDADNRGAAIQSVCIFGDSRTQLGLAGYYNATFADPKGLDIAPSFCGQGITATGTGTLEFRASDGALRWTAPSDTAGPWVVGYAGRILLESGTADKTLNLGVRSYSANPVTDQTISVTVSGTYQKGYWTYGFWVWANNVIGWLPDDTQPAGVGGSSTANVVEQLAYLETVAGGEGIDIILCGTNDISAGTASATSIANLTQIYDARRQLGRKLILVGEPARWNDAIGNPMTAQQQADHIAINSFIESYALSNGCVYIDSYSLTYDPDFSDRRPRSLILTDAVHFAETGAFIVGTAVGDAIYALTGTSQPSEIGDNTNLLSIGYMQGTSGTAGTGATGPVATGWTVNRLTTDATITTYQESRGDSGNWQVMSFSGTTLGNVQCFTSAQSLATLSIAAGDEIYGQMECVTEGLVNVYNLRCYIVCNGVTPALSVYSTLSGASTGDMGDGTFTLRTPSFKVPADMTGLSIRTQVQVKANSSGIAKVGGAKIVKIS